MHIMHIMHIMHTRETLSYFIYYAYCAYTSHDCSSEQDSAGHSVSSSVQQQQGHLCIYSTLLIGHTKHPESWSYANIVIAVCAKENA
jgi:hypothetical protein